MLYLPLSFLFPSTTTTTITTTATTFLLFSLHHHHHHHHTEQNKVPQSVQSARYLTRYPLGFNRGVDKRSENVNQAPRYRSNIYILAPLFTEASGTVLPVTRQ